MKLSAPCNSVLFFLGGWMGKSVFFQTFHGFWARCRREFFLGMLENTLNLMPPSFNHPPKILPPTPRTFFQNFKKKKRKTFYGKIARMLHTNFLVFIHMLVVITKRFWKILNVLLFAWYARMGRGGGGG